MGVLKAVKNASVKMKQIKERDRFLAGKGKRFKAGGYWGDKIDWFGDNPGFRIVGWKLHRPQTGDFLLSKMESGGTGVFVISNVLLETNPKDMFFADTLPVCMEDGELMKIGY